MKEACEWMLSPSLGGRRLPGRRHWVHDSNCRAHPVARRERFRRRPIWLTGPTGDATRAVRPTVRAVRKTTSSGTWHCSRISSHSEVNHSFLR